MNVGQAFIEGLHKKADLPTGLVGVAHLGHFLTNDDEHKTYEDMLTAVELEFAELQWFSKRLFELYLTLGSLKKVSNETQIPIASVGRYIREVKQEIRLNVIKKTQ